MNRVLVTGGGGFIGRHLLPLLVASGAEVHAVCRGSAPEVADKRVLWHQADMLDARQVKALVRQVKADQLIHLAWYTTPPLYWEAGENTLWLEASILLFREFADAGGKRVVAMGTCAEYDWSGGRCIEDSTSLAPLSLYGRSKNSLQASLAKIAASSGIVSTWARLFFPYGPGEHPSKLVTHIATALLNGQRASCSTPDQKRDFIYVTDVASAIVAVLKSRFSGAINIGSGAAVTVREVVEKVAQQIGRVDLLDLRTPDQTSNAAPLVVADIGKLGGVIHWTPAVCLDAGIAQTIEYCRGKTHS